MQTRKAVAAVAVASFAVIGLGTAVHASVLDQATTGGAGVVQTANGANPKPDHGKKWYWVKDDGSLVAIDDNNVGPFQGCHNFVPVNGVGGQVPVKDIAGIVGLDNDGNKATVVKTCEQDSEQVNEKKWYRAHGGLVSVSNNNVGPFQVCHNEVPVNGVGGQVPVSGIAGILGLGNDGNVTEVMNTCEQGSTQHN